MALPIPQPRRVPFLGNLFDIDANDTWGSFKKIIDQYGPIVKLELPGKQILLIGNVTMLDEVCDERRFRKNLHTSVMDQIRGLVHDGTFSAYYEEPSWGIARRIMNPCLAPSTDEVRVSEIQEMVSDLVAKWTSSSNQRVDVTDEMYRLHMQAIVYTFFGKRVNYVDGEYPDILATMDYCNYEMIKRSTRPKAFNWLFGGKYEKKPKDFRKYGADLIAAKRAEQEPKHDLLYAMLNSKDPETGESLDDERVIDEIVTVIIGAATTAALLSWTVYYLLKNPEEMAKARSEVHAVVGPDGQISASDIYLKLPHCEAILRETLRLSASAPGFNLEPVPSATDSGDKVMLAGGKYQIPKDQSIVVVLAAVNRDPTVFVDPESFVPERMLGDAYDKLPAAAKKGFGNGKRSCFGQRFAWQLCMVTMIMLLKDVDLKMADKDYKLKQGGAFFQAPLEFFASVGPRDATNVV